MYLSLHLGSMLSQKFLKCRKLKHIRNLMFNLTAELKNRKVMVFWPNREIQKLLKKPSKIEMPRKFNSLKLFPITIREKEQDYYQ